MSELRNRKAVNESEDTPNSGTPSNGSVKGDPVLTPSSEKELAYTSKEKENDKKPTQTPRNPTFLVVSTLIGGWVLAVIFAIGHHFFANWIKGKTVPDTPEEKPILDFQAMGQDSVKTAATAFVRFFSLSLTVAAGGVLTQMAWRVPRRHPVPLEKMDLIFKLPALGPTVTLVFSPWIRWLFFTIVLAFCIYGLEVVTMIAPQSLKVVPRYDSALKTFVPSLDLSNGTVESADIYSGGYIRPSALWGRVVQDTMISPTEVSLPPPSSCSTLGCSYNITYNAPALQCRDLSADEFNVTTTSNPPILYQGISTLWYLIDPPQSATAPPSNQIPSITSNAANSTNLNYTITLQWQPWGHTGDDTTNTGTVVKGIQCQFYDGTYMASIKFNGTNQAATTTLQSTGKPLVGVNGYQDSSCSDNLSSTVPSSACWKNAVNYRATAEAFSELLVGMIWYDDSGRISVYRSSYLIPFFNISTKIDPNDYQWSFDITEPNLGATLQGLLGNVTLAMIAARKDFAEVALDVIGAGNIWEYDTVLLWGIYGPTLVVFALFIAYGLWCVHVDGAMDKGFVDLFIATRGETIDKALSENESVEEIKGMLITSVKHGVFKAVGLDGLMDA